MDQIKGPLCEMEPSPALLMKWKPEQMAFVCPVYSV